MMNYTRILFDPTDSALVERLLKKSTREREEGLMVAVLGDAIECYQKYAFAKDEKGKKLFREAEEWIFEKNSDWLFSFENVCEILNLHADYVRRGLLCWRQASRKPRSETKIYSKSLRRKRNKAA